MPIFFQQQINATTRLGIWKIEETEQFFLANVPVQNAVTHPHKRLQHLAGRFLLQFLFADFPYSLIRIADTRKPYLEDEQYHFSISHCADFAAAIVSSDRRVGLDIETNSQKAAKVSPKFLSASEQPVLHACRNTFGPRAETLLWCCKESAYKWYGDGKVDFRKDIRLTTFRLQDETVVCNFSKCDRDLDIRFHGFENLVVAWIDD